MIHWHLLIFIKAAKSQRSRHTMMLDELLTMHHEAIGELQTVLKGSLAAEHDDIFILRFVLSHQDLCKAEAALRKTIAFRAEWHDLLQTVRLEGKPPHDSDVRR